MKFLAREGNHSVRKRAEKKFKLTQFTNYDYEPRKKRMLPEDHVSRSQRGKNKRIKTNMPTDTVQHVMAGFTNHCTALT